MAGKLQVPKVTTLKKPRGFESATVSSTTVSSTNSSSPNRTWRRVPSLILIMLAFAALSACKNSRDETLPVTQEQPLVEVNLTLAGASFEGASQVEQLRKVVQVRDQAGNLMRFKDGNVSDSQGERTELVVPAAVASLTLFLPAGRTYVFFGRAFDSAGSELAAATAERTTVDGGSNATVMKFNVLLGAAHLETRLPIRQLVPGQEIDLLLSITAHERPDLKVTSGDYRARYETGNATSLSYSERGIRLRAGDRAAGDVTVTASAAGLRLSNGGTVAGEISTTLSLPFSAGLEIDLDPPQVSRLAFDSEQQIFTGVADDDHSIVKLELYDGPVVLASSDPEIMSGKSVPEVIFPGGGTAFYSRLDMPAGDYTLTVVATDFSGNDTRAKHAVSVP